MDLSFTCVLRRPHQCCEHLRHLDFSHSLEARERMLWLCEVINLEFSGSPLASHSYPFGRTLLTRKRRLWLCGVIGYLLAHSSVIESLNLSNCGLDDDHASLIASGLEQNSSLKMLNISYNSITTYGAKIIVESLQEQSTLKSLDMSHNRITSDSRYHKDVVEALQHNCCLETYDLSNILHS